MHHELKWRWLVNSITTKQLTLFQNHDKILKFFTKIMKYVVHLAPEGVCPPGHWEMVSIFFQWLCWHLCLHIGILTLAVTVLLVQILLSILSVWWGAMLQHNILVRQHSQVGMNLHDVLNKNYFHKKPMLFRTHYDIRKHILHINYTVQIYAELRIKLGTTENLFYVQLILNCDSLTSITFEAAKWRVKLTDRIILALPLRWRDTGDSFCFHVEHSLY